jgi:hypothetical protein
VEGKIALLMTAAASALALLPAGDAAAAGGERVIVYKIARASGYIRADFGGDQGAGCQGRGVCGYQGVTAYRFGGTPRSAESFFLLSKRTGFVGGGNFHTTGQTVAAVSIPGSDPCSDSLPHSADSFQFTRRGDKITVGFHGAEPDSGADYLNTRCPGPGEVDLTSARALPTGTFPVNSFKSKHVTIVLSGQKPFTAGGFTGTASWNVVFGLTRSRSSSSSVTTF